MLPLDIQANYGHLEVVVKEVNKIQNLSQQINYNSTITLEKFAKEIYEKIIETNESPEQQHIEDRKKEEEKEKKKKKRIYLEDGTYIEYSMSEEEMKKKLEICEEYKGTFINMYK